MQNRKSINIYITLYNDHKSGWHVSAWIVWRFLTFFTSSSSSAIVRATRESDACSITGPVHLDQGCQKSQPSGIHWVKTNLISPHMGDVLLSIARVCPHSPRWGKTLIGALSLIKTDLRRISSGLVSNWSKIFANTSEHLKNSSVRNTWNWTIKWNNTQSCE